MPGLDREENTGFKARLYDHYLSQHVRASAETIQVALASRSHLLRRVIAAYLPPERSVRILDLGCGYGGFMHALRAAGYTNVAGVDISQEQIDMARQLGFEDVHCEDLRAFLSRVPDRKYDAVIAFDILEHFTRNELFELVDELHRVLAPGGRLIVHVPNAEGIFSGTVRNGDLTHELAFTRGSLKQLAGACGFRVAAVKEDVPVVHGVRSLVRYLLWTVLTFAFRVLAVAETGEGFRGKPMSQNLFAVLEAI